ncbi:hypothetical protein Hanom_Chr07g00626211 [Helianthus anomalus]
MHLVAVIGRHATLFAIASAMDAFDNYGIMFNRSEANVCLIQIRGLNHSDSV